MIPLATCRGLGLSSCYNIIKKHGGWINVHSEVGVGSTFTFYIPVKKGEQANMVEISPSHPGTGSILIMDDEETIRIALVSLLEVLGYTAVASADGTEALEKYKAAKATGKGFDLVILDITVPGGQGGIETVQKILNINPSARVIVTSGYATDPVMANFKDYGFAAILPKPFNPEKLQTVLGSVLSAQG